jgi:hypothetical protein
VFFFTARKSTAGFFHLRNIFPYNTLLFWQKLVIRLQCQKVSGAGVVGIKLRQDEPVEAKS